MFASPGIVIRVGSDACGTKITYHVDRIEGVDSDQILAVNIRSMCNTIDSREVYLFGGYSQHKA